MQFKTKTAAISHALLQGEVITIMDGFKRFGISNAPRELSRQVEQKFGVVISKVKKETKSDFGHCGYYFEYRLNKTPMNKEGIKKMWDYIDENLITRPGVSAKAIRGYVQSDIFNSHKIENYGL